jgi:hypothetical protein
VKTTLFNKIRARPNYERLFDSLLVLHNGDILNSATPQAPNEKSKCYIYIMTK